MDKKIVLITGANTGLGYQMVRALCDSAQAYEILVGGRSIEKAKQAANDVLAEFPSTKSTPVAIQVDVESDDSIQAAFETVQSKYGRLDALVNNAGAMFDAEGALSLRQAWAKSWDVNTAGTHIMTLTFVPLLLKSSDPRLLFMASGTSSLENAEKQILPIDQFPPKGWPKAAPNMAAYRSSKAGMNMMMRDWARLLHNDGVKVWALSPGYLASGLGKGSEHNKSQGAQDPVVAGPFVREVLEGKRDGHVGKVILRDGKIQPW
ncbi:unnamed protein product [Clonostachys chloroleuca]|uniref:Uncharacterized protein n=1 Tax=Clonostachys chloroleuca TaxID=1926264 RepID=A0AA35LUC3_9HYPO|nr:unnamed protein product [Clonostachys chloroleuca]